GDKGLFSRILCPFSGSFLTYCSHEEKTALGQINIIQLKDLLGLLNL
ncbi:MAG: type I 3-dehydroquinate dehydratase, partial [Candidatus Thorarchaeota archaeon]